MQIYNYNGWRILSFIPETNAEGIFDLVSRKEYDFIRILKKQKRSKVILFHFDKKEYVLKIPKQKNTNWWIRFTTLYRNGEAYRCIKSLKKLQQLGIPTAAPVMAAEKRKWGMVIDSWFVYNYIPGENCLYKEDHYPEVIRTLKNLHQKKYLHGDPQIRNFILSEKNIVHMIDAKLKPIVFSPYSKNHEWAYLAKSAPGIEESFSNKESLWFKLAKKLDFLYRRFVNRKRKFFQIIKNIFTL